MIPYRMPALGQVIAMRLCTFPRHSLTLTEVDLELLYSCLSSRGEAIGYPRRRDGAASERVPLPRALQVTIGFPLSLDLLEGREPSTVENCSKLSEERTEPLSRAKGCLPSANVHCCLGAHSIAWRLS